MTAACIRRLTLTNFRSYHAAQVSLGPAGPVVLTGANGAGKTNLIEAISLLAPGRGLRRATLEEIAFSEGDVLANEPMGVRSARMPNVLAEDTWDLFRILLR